MSPIFQNWINSKFGALIQNGTSDKPVFNNSNRVARILYRLSAYRRLSWHMVWRGVPAREIIRSQFPYIERSPCRPLFITIEFTNYCDLRCVYCTSPLGLRPRGFMQKEVFDRLVEGIKQLGVRRIRVIGNGEPTLHPDFALFTKQLAKAAPYLSVLTNGQWRRPKDIIHALLQAPVSMIEVSVDAATKDGYEKSRLGGSFERIIENLKLLKETKRRVGSRAIINLRIMMRPSERAVERQLRAFWQNFADTLMPQYLFERKFLTHSDDLYKPIPFVNESYPKCSLPFKALDVNWNGSVPLCNHSAQQIGPPGLILGNLITDNLTDLWNSRIMQNYRQGHYQRDPTQMPICKGCTGS